MHTPSVNPDPSVLIVSGETGKIIEQTLNEMYVLGLKHALEIIQNSFGIHRAMQQIQILIKKNTPNA